MGVAARKGSFIGAFFVDGAGVMLVLSRKSGASIRIGADIVISVLSIQGSRVRLGISAPADTDIWRAELIDGRERCRQDAAGVCPTPIRWQDSETLGLDKGSRMLILIRQRPDWRRCFVIRPGGTWMSGWRTAVFSEVHASPNVGHGRGTGAARDSWLSPSPARRTNWIGSFAWYPVYRLDSFGE